MLFAANPIYTGMGLRPKHKIIKQPVLLIFGKDDAALDYRMVPFMEVGFFRAAEYFITSYLLSLFSISLSFVTWTLHDHGD